MTKNENPLVDTIVNAIQDKKGTGIVVADMSHIADAVCRYFIICQGNSGNQVEAIARGVGDGAREKLGEKPMAVCGEQNAVWIALDYGDVMVHVFQPETRQFYDLEHLWADAALTSIPDLP
ncbi:MAG: ribosome silencing factor [Bacteroidaceae bacterium]|nr:ribosome silencing factor [Bacteroidaceae bacterium]